MSAVKGPSRGERKIFHFPDCPFGPAAQRFATTEEGRRSFESVLCADFSDSPGFTGVRGVRVVVRK